MLEDFTIETFADRIGERFGVGTGAEPIGFELVSATSNVGPGGRASGPPGRREPFSLEFAGPLEPILPQGTYPFEHAALGTFDLFVVPIGRDDAGTRYEAVFT